MHGIFVVCDQTPWTKQRKAERERELAREQNTGNRV